MGRETKTFRQTKRSGSADYSAKSYIRVNRSTGWNPFKLSKKGSKWQG